MVIIATGISVVIIGINYIITHRTTDTMLTVEEERRSQYECGIETFEEEIGKETRERFHIKFYVLGIIFLIFDLESLLLFPLTLTVYNNMVYNPGELILSYSVFMVFIIILIVGLIYEFFHYQY